MGTDRDKDSDDRISLDVDIDLQMTQIMSEARRATDAIRQTTEAIRESSGTASVEEPTTAEELVESDPEPPTAGFVLELEKLANGLQDIADSEPVTQLSQESKQSQVASDVAADPIKEALRELRAQHAGLTDSVSRMHAAVAEADASIHAFKVAMGRLEEATGAKVVDSELPTPEVATAASEPNPVASEPLPVATQPERVATEPKPVASGPEPDLVPTYDPSSRRAALQALRSLSE